MEAQMRVADDLSIFLKESKESTNRVYQLHRELGGVFIDASFQDQNNPGQLVKHRIEIGRPQHISSQIAWDEHGFPYELEEYQYGDTSFNVALYRQPGAALSIFLDSVAVEIDELEELPEEIQAAHCHIIEAVDKLEATISTLIDTLKLSLRDVQAIDAAFNESSLFEEPDLGRGFGEYLYKYIMDRVKQYSDKCGDTTLHRAEVFQNLEDTAITSATKELEANNFKRGFVSA